MIGIKPVLALKASLVGLRSFVAWWRFVGRWDLCRGGTSRRREAGFGLAWFGAVQARSVSDLVCGSRAEGGGGRRGRTVEMVGAWWGGAAGRWVEGFWVVRARSDVDLVGGHLVVWLEGRRMVSVGWFSWGGAAGWRRVWRRVVQARLMCVDLVRDHHVEGDGEGRRRGGSGRPETVGGLPLGLDWWRCLGLGGGFGLNFTFYFLFFVFSFRSRVGIHLSDPK